MSLSTRNLRKSTRHALLFACAVTLAGACGDRAAQRRPDVVLIVVDTLRSDHLSAYGYPRPTSPFLEELAQEGALFEDVTTQFSWTMPSMVSLFSGHYLTEFSLALPAGAQTLAEAFAGAGYKTLAVVSNQLLGPEAGFARGFDHYDVRTSRRTNDGATARTLEEIAEDLWPPLEDVLAAQPANDRAPVFLYLHTFDPHNPYHEHPDFDAQLPLDGALGVQPPGWQESEIARAGLAPEPGSDWSTELSELQLERGRYDQEVRYTDEQLRLLMKKLEELGLLEHAVVALVSDHGETLWEHVPPKPAEALAKSPPNKFFYQKHGAVQYQAVIATPMLLWGSGVPHGVRVSHAVENVDLFPTLLELADVPARGGELHGRSLVDAMHGRAGEWRQFVFSYSVHGNSVREPESGLKLLMPRGASEVAGWPVQLFDLNDDPHERSNLADGRPDDVRRLVAAYEEWVRTYPTQRIESADQARIQGEIDRRRNDALRALGYTDLDTGIEDHRQ